MSYHPQSLPSYSKNIDTYYKKKPRSFLDKKAELYSILKTAHVLKRGFDSGRLDPSFYFKNMHHFYNKLIELEQEMRSRTENLRDLLEEFPMGSDLKPMLAFISAICDYKYDNIAKKWQINPFQLAKSAMGATSNFITIIDYFHLINYVDIPFIGSLISNLHNSLEEVSMFHPFVLQVESLHQHLISQLQSFSDSKHIMPEESIKLTIKSIEDQFYQIYLEFKETLSYSP